MKILPLTLKNCFFVRERIANTCGTLAGVGAGELLDSALKHGKNQTYQLFDLSDRLMIIIESDCPLIKRKHHRSKEHVGASIINSLCKEGVVSYYNHSISSRHHLIKVIFKKNAAPFYH